MCHICYVMARGWVGGGAVKPLYITLRHVSYPRTAGMPCPWNGDRAFFPCFALFLVTFLCWIMAVHQRPAMKDASCFFCPLPPFPSRERSRV